MKYGPLGRLFNHMSTPMADQKGSPRKTSRRIAKIKPAEDILDFEYPEASAFYQADSNKPTQ